MKAVFGGPSLSTQARQKAARAGFELLDPARRGDVAVLIGRADIVVLLDGYFGWTLSVSHTEIRDALNSGVAIVGASSLGALRASELRSTSIIGVGWVFERYQEGTLWNDDEVALLHAPKELAYEPLTLPLVNLRATSDLLVTSALISPAESLRIVDAAKAISYKQRTWTSIRLALAGSIERTRSALISDLLQTHYVDQKKRDALCAIEVAATLPLRHAASRKLSRPRRASTSPASHSSNCNGVARFCGLSGLDDLPWEVVAAVRQEFVANPIALGSGRTAGAAVENALAESIEFAALEQPAPDDAVEASYASVRLDAKFVKPWHLPGFRQSLFKSDAPMNWVPCFDILSGEPFFIPHAAIAFNAVNPYWFSTNGMAASKEEQFCLLHALFELAERHIVSEYALRGSQLNIPKLRLLDPGPRLSPELHDWLLSRMGAIYPLHIDNPSGLHCYMTFLITQEDESERITIGYGCSEDEGDAYDKSLKEAAQVRMAYISGARPGLKLEHFSRGTSVVSRWLAGLAPVGSVPVASLRQTMEKRVQIALEALTFMGERELFRCSFGRRQDAWHVTKILAPRLRFDHRAF